MKSKSFNNNMNYIYQKEKRFSDRVPVKAKFKVNADTLHITNISIGGIGGFSTSPVKKGDIISSDLLISDFIGIPLTIMVMWTGCFDKGYLFGAKIIGLQSYYQPLLSSYIKDKEDLIM